MVLGLATGRSVFLLRMTRHSTTQNALRIAGKVAFDFSVDLGRVSRPGLVQASPSAGHVAAGERAHIKLRVCPGIPERLMELVLLQVGGWAAAGCCFG